MKKISKEKELEIIELYKRGNRMEDICNKYNIHHSTGYSVLNRNNIQNHHKYDLDETFFSNIDTEEKAYWLGFITADGYIHNNTSTLGIGLKKDDSKHLKKFKMDLKTTNKIKYGQTILNNKIYFYCRININSTKIVKDLKKYGVVPRKSLTIKPYTKLNEELQKHYWRGMIDGDGCINNRKGKNKWRLSLVGNKYIINGFKKYIKKRFDTKANPSKLKNVWTFSCGGNIIVKKIITYFYKDATVFLDRKMKLAQEIMNMKNYVRPSKFDYITREILINKYKELGEWKKVSQYFKMSSSSGVRLKKKRGLIGL